MFLFSIISNQITLDQKHLKSKKNTCFFPRTSLDFRNGASSQPLSSWNIETGYKKPLTGEPYPNRVYGTGKQYSLTILVRVFNYDIDRLCTGAVQGFKVTFHPPNEGPQILKRYYLVSPGKTALFTISPKVILSVPNIRSYTSNVRKCYFGSERKLRFFKSYTQHNCEIECLANYTLAECGCVKFSMPRKINHWLTIGLRFFFHHRTIINITSFSPLSLCLHWYSNG